MNGRLVIAAAAAAILSFGAASHTAQAAPGLTGEGVRIAIGGLSPVESVQFRHGGRNYCWYSGGWRGPGWYWCGYAQRRGMGWGGARGWRGWSVPGHGPRRMTPPPPRRHGPPPPRRHYR